MGRQVREFSETQNFEFCGYYVYRGDKEYQVTVDGTAFLKGWYIPAKIGNSVEESCDEDGDSEVSYVYTTTVYDTDTAKEVQLELTEKEKKEVITLLDDLTKTIF